MKVEDGKPRRRWRDEGAKRNPDGDRKGRRVRERRMGAGNGRGEVDGGGTESVGPGPNFEGTEESEV